MPVLKAKYISVATIINVIIRVPIILSSLCPSPNVNLIDYTSIFYEVLNIKSFSKTLKHQPNQINCALIGWFFYELKLRRSKKCVD